MPLTLPPSTRTRSRRWEALRDLVAHIDALVAINVHVDSLLVSGHSIVADVVTFERELERVRTALLYEIDRATADALNADLAAKIKKKNEGRS